MRAAVERVARATCIAGGLFSCGAPERPAPANDLNITPPVEEEPSLVDSTPAPPDLHSPCGAATLSLEHLRPNLYFAIDASGSMSEDIPRSEAVTSSSAPWASYDRYAALSLAIQGLLQRVGHRVNYGATLFPTGDRTCDAGEEILELSRGDAVSFAVSGKSGPVLDQLMFSINRRTPRGGTPVTAAIESLLPKLRDRGSETYLFLVTDGGPNCNGTASCGPETCIPNLERALLSDEQRCDAPINCCSPELFGPENCLDANGSLGAVSALARAGVRTIVIGIPGSEAFADVLDQLALAGGMARAESPRYYRAIDADQLIETVSSLGLGVALSCSIQLAEPPPDPTLVNVFFDGQLVPADPVDGWAFQDSQTVQLLGNSCALLKTGEVLQADIVAGCPVVIR
ncbi:MAG: hypothetical protein RL033_1077 [Pseudomonadota bacterium]|jgi:hypothetical protein